jgi:hypothetical protein
MLPISFRSRFTAAAFSVAICLAAFTPAASADLIYDNTAGGTNGGTFTTTGSSPRNYMADGLSTIATPEVWQEWEVQSMRWQVFVSGSGTATPITYNNVTARVRVYDEWTPSQATGSVFTGLVSDVIWSLGNVTNNSATGGAQAFTYTLPYATSDLAFSIGDGQNMGFAVEILVNGVANSALATIIRGGGFDPVIGTSPNGWYRDSDADGIIEQSDARTLGAPNNPSHLAFSFDALAIPEPASAGLALGGLLLLARRRRA